MSLTEDHREQLHYATIVFAALGLFSSIAIFVYKKREPTYFTSGIGRIVLGFALSDLLYAVGGLAAQYPIRLKVGGKDHWSCEVQAFTIHVAGLSSASLNVLMCFYVFHTVVLRRYVAEIPWTFLMAITLIVPALAASILYMTIQDFYGGAALFCFIQHQVNQLNAFYIFVWICVSMTIFAFPMSLYQLHKDNKKYLNCRKRNGRVRKMALRLCIGYFFTALISWFPGTLNRFVVPPDADADLRFGINMFHSLVVVGKGLFHGAAFIYTFHHDEIVHFVKTFSWKEKVRSMVSREKSPVQQESKRVYPSMHLEDPLPTTVKEVSPFSLLRTVKDSTPVSPLDTVVERNSLQRYRQVWSPRENLIDIETPTRNTV
jgi:hypothetical protein